MTNPNFKKIVKGLGNKEKIIPVLFSYLTDPKFPAFDIHIPGYSNRKPDGWFHPSTHPLWTERQLYYYITKPNQMVHERFEYLSSMAVTSGTFWHEFVQTCLLDCGLFLDTEVKVSDPEAKSRGSMDAVMEGEAVELKTMNDMKMAKLPKGGAEDPVVQEAFRLANPTYAAQANEYMRISGYSRMRFLIIATGYPFNMKEIVLPYDKRAALEVRDKYMRVLQHAADQTLPKGCCSPQSAMAKKCGAREVCPIGQM